MKLESTPAADRYFAPDPAQRRVAHEIYDGVAGLPIISPHCHVDPRLLTDPDATFGTPTDLFVSPDHYILRMLHSQGIPLEALGVPVRDADHGWAVLRRDAWPDDRPRGPGGGAGRPDLPG